MSKTDLSQCSKPLAAIRGIGRKFQQSWLITRHPQFLNTAVENALVPTIKNKGGFESKLRSLGSKVYEPFEFLIYSFDKRFERAKEITRLPAF